MLKAFNICWEKIGAFGLQFAKTPHDQKAVKMMNRVSIISAAMMCMFSIFAVFMSDPKFIPFIFIFTIIFLCIPFINYHGKLELAKIFSCLSPLVIITFVGMVVREGGDKYYLFISAMIPLILFRKKWKYFLFFELNVFAFLFVTWYQENYPSLLDMHVSDITVYYYTNMVSLFFATYIVLHFFINTNQSYEKELIEKNKLLDERNKEVTDSINYAKRIQYTLLAHDAFLKENLPDHFVFFKPKDIVSGDFYWATKNNNRFFLAVCDSTGHGVPGAFMSLLNISFLNEAINEKNLVEPGQVFDHVRKRLIENISQSGGRDGMDAILIACSENKIKIAAANNSPVLIRNGEMKELNYDKMPIGFSDKKDNFSQQELQIQKGDLLYLYTDGYSDQFGGPKGKKLKETNLKKKLLEISSHSLKEQMTILEREYEIWKGDLEQVDDVCIIAVRF